MPTPSNDVTEQTRLNDAREKGVPWKKWGPYLSERQWGTVREDYSDDGNAWGYFSHDQSRSRAYRWGEDGLGGISDDKQRLCFALAVWNGQDAILKERLFGLTNSEGNHGEDAKEYYFYVDSTPTHSYMKYLYKYPQREFPYRDLVDTNRGRSREEMEYELLDTGVFDGDRYFDVFVEYAKASPEDILVRITVHNRGADAARLHVLPTLWFRNTWSWGDDDRKPVLRAAGPGVVEASHHELGTYRLLCEGEPDLLFTENESNAEHLWGQPSASPYVKDAFHRYLAGGRTDAVNPARVGTKAAADYVLDVPGGGHRTIRLRLSAADLSPSFKDFDQAFAERLGDADEFYTRITPPTLNEDQRRVHRQALAGMLWSKQFYYFDLERWLQRAQEPPAARIDSARGSEHVVVPHAQRRHHLDAGQVGVSVVRGMGSRVPYRGAGAGRFRLREGPAAVDAARPLLPSERADPRLRMELQRREPAGPRLGDAVPVQDGAHARPGRPALPGALVPEPDAELQLVGQPEGSLGTQRVRGRVPRPRQHRRVRPERRAADRRLPGAGRRHGVDGVLLPVHAGDGADPGRIRSDLRGRRLQVRPALRLHLLRHRPDRRAPRRDVGRGGRVLLRRPANARRPRHAPQGAIDGRPAAALRVDGVPAGRSPSGSRGSRR